jgi:AbrB family looped-hinge helix DNA binding protein
MERAMKQISAKVTERGQVTIPAEVRRALGLNPPAKVIFKIEGSEVRLVPAAFTLETAFGSVKPLPGAAIDLDEQIRQAKEDRAAQLASRMAENPE